MTTALKENPFAGQGSVLLDIGGDVGALVVTMPVELVDVEVEIRAVGGGLHHTHDHGSGSHQHHPHVAVVERPVAGGLVPSLVFPQLVEGSYQLCIKETDAVCLTVEVRGGEVASAIWPA